MENNEAIGKILNFVRQIGGSHSDFIVGITNNVGERLKQHGASNKPRVIHNIFSRQDAKDTENFLLSRYGFKGDTGGGESDTTWIYCFKA